VRTHEPGNDAGVSALLLFGGLVVGVIVLTPLASRIGVPQPVLLTIFGLAVALLPFSPDLRLDPDLILPVVLPPLLFAATQRTHAREFREHVVPVLLLAVGLTVATAVAVAVVAHAVGLGWKPAWVLGAIVSPPDPVAATAVARRLRLPQRLVSVLEGEGMFNDATALVIYKVAVVAAVTGGFSVTSLGLDLLLAVVVGVAVGIGLGWVTRWALLALVDAAPETTVTAIMPFAAYLAAEHLRGSGVLAVLALGLFLRSYGHSATTSQGWLLGRAVWGYADFVITSLVFTLVGYALVKIGLREEITADTVVLAVAVLVVVVALRPLWIFPAAWLIRRHAEDTPVGWRECAVASWAGMRGVVSVATAVALPLTLDSGAAFAERQQVVLVSLACVLATLVVQGLTLAPLVSRLGVAEPGSGAHDIADLRRRAAEAGLEQVRKQTGDGIPDAVREAAIQRYEGYVVAQQAVAKVREPTDEDGEDPGALLDEILGDAIAAERELVLEARERGEVSAATADEALRDIEGRAIRDFG
jgi:monovalent cation/hydrogen antiporter